MAGKSGAETAHQIHVARTNLRAFAQDLARFGIDQVQPAAGSDVLQSFGTQRGLHLAPVFRSLKRLCDEKPKAPEELLVDDFVTPRGASLTSLYLKPHKIAQHGTGGFIAAVTGGQEPLPKLWVAGEGGLMCHARSLPKQS